VSDFLGIPKSRLPIAVAMVIALAAVLSWLQGRFDTSDVKKGIALALSFKPATGSRNVFEGLAARKEGDPRCDGEVVSTLLGDVRVRCTTPGQPQREYEFRVLLDGKRPPRPSNAAAEELVKAL
jgi:hypothetical protein